LLSSALIINHAINQEIKDWSVMFVNIHDMHIATIAEFKLRTGLSLNAS
jgi:hypothetical protein